MEYGKLSKGEDSFKLDWKNGGWVKDGINKKIYRIKNGKLELDNESTRILSKSVMLERLKTFIGLSLVLVGIAVFVRKAIKLKMVQKA